ncbi:MAG: amidinotransferase, partial [Gemmatimonadales bacterium]
MKTYGGQTMWGPLRRVVVRRPDAAFGSADPTVWHYAGRPDLDTALHEHASLVSIVASRGCEVIHHDEPLADHADAIFC